MIFSPDHNKQAEEVIFIRIYGMVLETELDFHLHLKNVQNKVNKTIGHLRKLPNTFLRTSLITIFKSFIMPHLDYGDIIYDRVYNTSFQQ